MYERDFETEKVVKKILELACFNHIAKDRIFCVKNKKSKSKYVLARCHSLNKIMQLVLQEKPCYVIEIIEKNFSKLSKEEKIKTLIHELLHIPKSFRGGFVHHHKINKKKIEKIYRKGREKFLF